MLRFPKACAALVAVRTAVTSLDDFLLLSLRLLPHIILMPRIVPILPKQLHDDFLSVFRPPSQHLLHLPTDSLPIPMHTHPLKSADSLLPKRPRLPTAMLLVILHRALQILVSTDDAEPDIAAGGLVDEIDQISECISPWGCKENEFLLLSLF